MNIPEFSVSEFSRSIKHVVEDAFGYVRIRGEISGFKRAASGHLYFNLKDEDALLNAVCFKNMAQLIDLDVADGLQIVASGRITTFGGRSNYQITVEKIEIAGIGAILEMLEKRRQKLAAEGLFDVIHKKPIPFFARKIGVITSKDGAVIQDILHRVEARCPTHLLLYPVLTQGRDAASSVIAALKYFGKMKASERPELLIIARGGGSFEDLLPFSDEDLVRAAFACEIPLISAIGHETDNSLLDLVADLRAPTPSAAAELATPILQDLLSQLEYFTQKLFNAQERFFSYRHERLMTLALRMITPDQFLQRQGEKLNFLAQKLKMISQNIFDEKSAKLQQQYLSAKIILYKIESAIKNIENLAQNLRKNIKNSLTNHENTLENLAKLLKTTHYQEILKRGFSLVKTSQNKVISSCKQVKIKEELLIEMFDGEFNSYVLSRKIKGENTGLDNQYML